MSKERRRSDKQAARFRARFDQSQTASAQELAIPSWLTVEGFTGSRALQAVSAAKEWAAVYGVERSIVIKPLPKEEKVLVQDGISYTVLEDAGAGYIRLSDEGNVRNIILHSMTHASKPDDPTIFAGPVPFSGGVIRGFHGLNVLVTTSEGEDTGFRAFEEGVCERNASFFKGYSVPEAKYFRVGSLTRDLFPPHSSASVTDMVRTNDVPSFVRRVLFLPESELVTTDNLLHAMSIYNENWRV